MYAREAYKLGWRWGLCLKRDIERLRFNFTGETTAGECETSMRGVGAPVS